MGSVLGGLMMGMAGMAMAAGETNVPVAVTEAPAVEAKTNAPAGPVVVLETSEGKIEIELFAEKAPITVSNFLAYVEAKFYDDTVFHRVIPNFMIQGGGFDQAMNQKSTRMPIKNEADNGIGNERGTVAMARTMVVNSATAQFFINTVNNRGLNHGARDFGYAVFGRVVNGMDVVDKISAVKTTVKGGMPDVPATPVTIKSARLK